MKTNKSVELRKGLVASSLLPAAFFLILSVLLLQAGPSRGETAEGLSRDFVVNPYIQLGNNPSLMARERLDLVWFSLDPDGPWQVRYNKKAIEPRETRRVGMIAGRPFFKHVATLDGLPPGKQVVYEVARKGRTVYSGSTTARKSRGQDFSFAVFGDTGAGSFGQRKVAFQCFQKKPDLLVIPGDLVYDRGRVSEYLSRFFPILNSARAGLNSGAPLMASTLTIAVLGNHDVANCNYRGTDLNRYPDALGYFIFFEQPLNGPVRIANSRNSTPLSGSAENQLDFIKAAGKNFPATANYSFDYGNSHWLILDANGYMNWNDNQMLDYVRNDLKKSKAVWKFVSFHQPSFSIDRVHFTEQRMRLLCDIFEKEGVTAVFSGHAHNYQRSYPLKFAPHRNKSDGKAIMNADGTVDGELSLDQKFDGQTNCSPAGVIYIISGAGGAALYARADAPPEAQRFNKIFKGDCHSFTYCSVKGKQLRFTQVSEDGDELDSFSVTKGSQP
ncbi:MAG: metallophosphoesterase [Candidatus Obscuribacterales bacterium]